MICRFPSLNSASIPGIRVNPCNPCQPSHRRDSNCEVIVFRFHKFGRRLKHTGGDGQVGSLLDQDEGTGQTIVSVAVEDERPRRAQAVRLSPGSRLAIDMPQGVRTRAAIVFFGFVDFGAQKTA